MSKKTKESEMTPEEEFQSYLAKIDSGEGEFLFKAGFCYIKGYGTEQAKPCFGKQQTMAMQLRNTFYHPCIMMGRF